MNIRFLYFDLGNVLLNFDHRRAAQQMAQVAGVPVETAWRLIFEGDLQRRVESGEMTDRAFYDEFCQQTGTQADYETLRRAGSDIFWMNQPIIPLVGHLRMAGYPLGILSNTSDSHWQFVNQGQFAVLRRTFREQVLSYEVGAAKPGPEIYQIAIERAGFSPGEIFFCDDRADNVEGARAVGIDAVQFVGVAELAADLRERGVRFNY